MNWNELMEKISKMSEKERLENVKFVTYEHCFIGDYYEVNDVENECGNGFVLTSNR